MSQKRPDESLIEWFDRSCEDELRLLRDNISMGQNLQINDADLIGSPDLFERVAEAGASCIEIASEMLKKPDSDLTEACKKFAIAEAICGFEGGLRNASSAGPNLQETHSAENESSGNIFSGLPDDAKPIEVVAYMGVTEPRFPKKSNY